MNKIMFRIILIALVLIIFGFKDTAVTLLDGMLSIVKWIFIIGGIAFVIFIIFGFFGKKK